MTDAQTGYAAIGELQMYYEVHGSGPPLVLLHGAYMSADAMAPLRDGLLRRARRSCPRWRATPARPTPTGR